MSYAVGVLIVSVVLACFAYGMKELADIEKRIIDREEIFQKWIFESLYSIDHKVLLPEEHEKKSVSKPAKIYSPIEDPMNEFTIGKDDFYEQ